MASPWECSLDYIGDDDVARIGPVYRNMDDGAHMVAGDGFNSQTAHQFVIACGHRKAIYFGRDAVSADLLDVRDPAAVDLSCP